MINANLEIDNESYELIPRKTIQGLIATLNEYITAANDVSDRSTAAEINWAKANLHKAIALSGGLTKMGVLHNSKEIGEDLRRIEEKIFYIRLDKINKTPRRRRP